MYSSKGSNTSNHTQMNDHQKDFNNARVIDKGDHQVQVRKQCLVILLK